MRTGSSTAGRGSQVFGSALVVHRQLLLRLSLAHAVASTAVPTAVFVHDHLVPPFGAVALLTTAALALAILRLRELGGQRRRLLPAVLLTGPLGPWILARRTRALMPVLLLRPASRQRW